MLLKRKFSNNANSEEKKKEKFIQHAYQEINGWNEILPISPFSDLTWSKPDFYIAIYCKKIINVESILIKILMVPLN